MPVEVHPEWQALSKHFEAIKEDGAFYETISKYVDEIDKTLKTRDKLISEAIKAERKRRKADQAYWDSIDDLAGAVLTAASAVGKLASKQKKEEKKRLETVSNQLRRFSKDVEEDRKSRLEGFTKLEKRWQKDFVKQHKLSDLDSKSVKLVNDSFKALFANEKKLDQARSDKGGSLVVCNRHEAYYKVLIKDLAEKLAKWKPPETHKQNVVEIVKGCKSIKKRIDRLSF